MVLCGMVLSEIVGAINFCFSPVHMKLVLAYAVTNPVEAHVDGFGSFLLDCVVR